MGRIWNGSKCNTPRHTFGMLAVMNFMKTLFTFLLLCVVCLGYSQSPELKKLLEKKFSAESTEDGRWVYYPDQANITLLETPLINSRYPHALVYRVTLTNYLGYHVNTSACVIMHDTVKRKITLVEPLWYSGLSKPFLKQFLMLKFDSKEKLLAFVSELNTVMETGSAYKFELSSYSDSVVTYSLTYDDDGKKFTPADSTVATSTIKYKERKLMRNIRMTLNDLAIQVITESNPITGTTETIK